MNRKKHAILAALVVVLLTGAPTFGQSKSEGAKPEHGNVLLRFMKDGTVSASCSQTIGLITQSMLQIEGVKNAKIDAKENGVQVSFDPSKTTPEKIVLAFNKENPETPLQKSDSKRK